MSNFATELENAYYDSIRELKEGDVVKGKVVSITPKEVIVDVGYKSEGIINRDEFTGIDVDGLGEFEVYVENVEDEEGKIILSYRRAQEVKGWQTLLNEYKEGDMVEGCVVNKVKGGYIVDIFGVKGFLPKSLSTFRSPSDEVLNEKLFFQIVKMSRTKGNFILSRKDAVRVEREMMRKKVWGEIEPGKLVKGRVKSITNFGAFIDLGGVDGLLHIADMSWKKITHPSEIVAVGDEIQIMILEFDKEKGKISLGLKQTTPDPWGDIEGKYPVDSTITGRVTNIQNYGIFLELEKGIEGLVHISEVSWTKRFINLHDIFAIGDTVEAKVISVEPSARKISLSIKQLEADPWDDVENMVTIDSTTKGKVTGFGEGCAYVEVENGLEGVVYNDDLSWTKRVNRAQEILKRGANLEFKVLGIDRENRKIILGRKQLTEDPWPQILEKYPIGKVVEAEVVKSTNFGIFAKLEDELEGLIFSGEMDEEMLGKLQPKDKLQVKIIKIDPGSAKIGLSAKIDEDTASESTEES